MAIRLNKNGLQRDFQRMLGVNLEIAVARRPVSQARLTPSEASQFAQVAGPRQDSWLRGRAALKTLLSQVMGEEDTSTLAFPSHWVSLTHSSGCTVAVASPLCVMGVGVDLEVARLPRPESARFFLAASEREWLEGEPSLAISSHLLRLWTVKEALFKADPGNQGRGLLDFRVADPRMSVGHACALSDPLLEMRYASVGIPEGFMSVAISRKKETLRC